MHEEIRINKSLTIPLYELSFTASHSSKPGGQNVNKTETRITLEFDVENSDVLTDQMRNKIKKALATRITKNGILKISSQKFRTQQANKNAAVDKFADLMSEALKRKRKRKHTKTPKKAKEARIKRKKEQSEKKKLRKKIKPPAK